MRRRKQGGVPPAGAEQDAIFTLRSGKSISRAHRRCKSGGPSPLQRYLQPATVTLICDAGARAWHEGRGTRVRFRWGGFDLIATRTTLALRIYDQHGRKLCMRYGWG